MFLFVFLPFFAVVFLFFYLRSNAYLAPDVVDSFTLDVSVHVFYDGSRTVTGDSLFPHEIQAVPDVRFSGQHELLYTLISKCL